MASFCSLLSGITVTQVSGSDKHFTVNVVGLTTSQQYSLETYPDISPVNVNTSLGSTVIQNDNNTYSFTKSALDAATTIKLNIKLNSSGATVNSSTLIWSQFKGFSTSSMTSMTSGQSDTSDMVVSLAKVFTQPITFQISSVYNETVRVLNNGGMQLAIITSIDSGSIIKTPSSVNPELTFDTTITETQNPAGFNYLLIGWTTLNGVESYILAEPFVFTTTFRYKPCTLIDRLFVTELAATEAILIIDGGSVV